MRRVLDLRIVRWELKLAYVVGALVVSFALSAVLRGVGLPALVVALVGVGVDLAAILLGARIFRGRGEPIGPPRERWRMTARPRLSTVLGIVFLVASIWLALGFVFEFLGVYGSVPMQWNVIAAGVATIIEFAVIGALYLRSGARLRSLGVPPKEPKEPKFKPTVRIRP
ncbi:MAG: hypothetical protein HOQ00_00740 [Agromyces sp.]|nr:hypothetical protein [Agromyces sp.]